MSSLGFAIKPVETGQQQFPIGLLIRVGRTDPLIEYVHNTNLACARDVTFRWNQDVCQRRNECPGFFVEGIGPGNNRVNEIRVCAITLGADRWNLRPRPGRCGLRTSGNGATKRHGATDSEQRCATQ